MIAGNDLAANQFFHIKKSYVIRGTVVRAEPEHLVEIAVIQVPIPADREGCSAHHALKGSWIEGVNEVFHIVLVVVCFLEVS